MEFRDLKKQYKLHKTGIDEAIHSVLENTDFIMGKSVKQLEDILAEYVGVKHCITCANGTDALQLALMAWGIQPGDAVFVPDFTFFSSGEVVSALGATPVFVDIEEATYNICPNSLETAIVTVMEESDLLPKVIIAVDLFGQPANYDEIEKIAKKYHLCILEDGAQGFGGSIREKKVCSFGDISTTSFFPAKPLGCYGDGGAIFTDNNEYAEHLRSLRIHGKGTDKYDNVRIGMNSRLDTLQAAILLEKMKFFDEEVFLCNQIAEEYTKRLKDLVKTPVIKPLMKSSWAQYTICLQDTKERNAVINKLKEEGIPSAVYYKKPMHLQQAFQGTKIGGIKYPISERISRGCLSLPMHPYLEIEAAKRVCDIIKVVIENKK